VECVPDESYRVAVEYRLAALIPHRSRKVREQLRLNALVDNPLTMLGAEGDVLIDGAIGMAHMLALSE